MRLLTPFYALSLAGAVLADCGVEGGTIVVANPNYDILDELEACSTIYGDILVDPGFVYFFLDGPLEITGTLIAHDNQILKAVTLSNVTTMGGFSFKNPDITGRIYLPEVSHIGLLEWQNLPFDHNGIEWLEWSAPKLTSVGTLHVEGTDLSGFLPDYPSYDGVSFYYEGLEKLETADNIRVIGNGRMDKITFSGIKTVSGTLEFANNLDFSRGIGKKRSVGGNRLISLPLLESAGNINIYDGKIHRSFETGSIELPILTHVAGDFNITKTEGFTDLLVPELTTIDGGLNLLNPENLKTIDFPSLRTVDSIIIRDVQSTYDGGLDKISFPSLEKIRRFHIKAWRLDCTQFEAIKAIATDFSCINRSQPPPPSSFPPMSFPTPPPGPVPTSESNHPDEPATTPTPTPTSKPGPGSEPDPSSEPSGPGVDEPSATSDSMQTNQTTLTNDPVATGPSQTTGVPGGEGPTGASQDTPGTSGASSLTSPFRGVVLLLRRLF